MIRQAKKQRTFSFIDSKSQTLLQKAAQTNRLHGLFREGDRVLIGLSGGPDSAAMAGILHTKARKMSLILLGAHLNHGLSGQAGKLESAAKKTAEVFKIPFYRQKADVRGLARRQKISIETAGRQARYAYFVKLARRLRANAIATAHTRNDQAETVFFRIIRGSSLRGLSGIPYVRQEDGIRLIRPVLDLQKNELMRYAAAARLPFVLDRSNRSGQYRRNRIRHEVFPLLEKRLNPCAQDAIANLQQACQDLIPLIDLASKRAWAKCAVQKGKGRLVLSRLRFNQLKSYEQNEVFFRVVESLGLGRRAVGRTHAETVCQLAKKAGLGTAHLPGLKVQTTRTQIICSSGSLR